MKKERKNSFLGGMATMAVALAIVKVIGAVYKIPIRNILGDSYTDFQNAYDIYTLLLTISITGLPAALSKMVAANHAVGRERQVAKIFRVALAAFFGLGFVSFLVMFFGADWLADWMNDTQAAQAIRYLAPAAICVSCVSAFRGFFQGHGNMRPSAVSQVIEALGKLVIGLPLAMMAVNAGKGDQAAALAILGVTLGSALTLVYMLWCYGRRSRYRDRSGGDVTSSKAVLRELLPIAIPITLTSAAVSLINTIDAALVQGRLQDALLMTEDQSRSLYAAYAGAKNIYNLPASFMMAVTVSVIPAVSAALAINQRRQAAKVVRASYHITALLVFPMGVGMSVLAEPIVRLLYSAGDPELTGQLLTILGVASIFVCLSSVSNSVMQAYGHQSLPVLVMIGAGLVMLAVDYILVGTPSIGIFGSPIGTLCCFGIATVADLVLIRRLVPHPPRYFRLFFGPALATAGMALAAWGSYRLARLAVGNAIALCVAILCAVAVYAFLVVWLKMLSRSELQLMPKGDKIADLLKLP